MMVERGLVDQTDIILGPSYKGSAIALSAAIALYTATAAICFLTTTARKLRPMARAVRPGACS